MMSKWINIKDRLPEKHGWYLIAHKKVCPTDSGMRIRFFSHGGFVNVNMNNVTHWRPLPEYPIGKTAEEIELEKWSLMS